MCTNWQETLCEILEESTDRQDDVFVWDRDWNPDKVNAFQASCIGLIQEPNHEPALLARMLRCFCDAESGGMQNLLRMACELFCSDPYDDAAFVSEVIKAAPEMLKRSPEYFGGFMMSPMITAESIKNPGAAKVFQSLSQEERQVVIDYWTFRLEKCGDPNYIEFYTNGLNAWLAASGLKEGNSKYFRKYFDKKLWP